MPRTLDRVLDLRAGSLHQPAVLHAGRTRRFAAAARQTKIEMLDVRRIDLRCARSHLHHLVDAAARRIHLHAELAIRRAVVQTQARNARSGRDPPASERHERGRQMRPYNLPRFNKSFGSNICLIFCMTGKSLPGCGHSVKDRFAGFGRKLDCSFLHCRPELATHLNNRRTRRRFRRAPPPVLSQPAIASDTPCSVVDTRTTAPFGCSRSQSGVNSRTRVQSASSSRTSAPAVRVVYRSITASLPPACNSTQ